MGNSAGKETLVDCLEALRNPDVDLNQEELWEDLFSVDLKEEEVLGAVTPGAVRGLREERWDGLAALLMRCGAKVCEFLERPEPVDTPLQSEMLVALRILTKVWPVLMSEPTDFILEFLWRRRPTCEFMPFLDPEADPEYRREHYSLASLVLQACFHLMFFPEFATDSFSLNIGDDYSQNPHIKYNLTEPSLVWAAGVGVTVEMLDETDGYEGNRVEVLRALAALLSADLFADPAAYFAPLPPPPPPPALLPPPPPPAAEAAAPAAAASAAAGEGEAKGRGAAAAAGALVGLDGESPPPFVADPPPPVLARNRCLQLACSEELPFCAEAFYSLLNWALAFDPVGWGLPFGAAAAGPRPARLLQAALQTLLLLLSYGERDAGRPKFNMHAQVQPGFNIFRRHLSMLETDDEFEFVLDGILRLLRAPAVRKSTYFPKAISQVEVSGETLLLLHRFVLEAEDFHLYVLKYPQKTAELISVLCYITHEAVEVAESAECSGEEFSLALGHIGVCMQVLRRLSEHRQLGLSLRLPFGSDPVLTFPAPAKNSASYADLVVLTIHTVMMIPHSATEPFYKSMTSVLYNVSPFIPPLTKTSCLKLMGLVELFSKLKFVMKSEERRETLLALLKVINNIVMYQYQGNHALVYELIHRKETTFIKLAALSPDILDFKALLASSDQEEEGAGRRSEDLLAKQLQSRLALLEQAAAPQGKADTDTENWEQVEAGTPVARSGVSTPKQGISGAQSRRGSEAHALRARSRAASTEHAQQAELHQDKKALEWETRVKMAKNFISVLKSSASLRNITKLLQHLEPQCDNLQVGHDVVQEEDITLFLQDTSTVGVLPPPEEFVPVTGMEKDADTYQWINIFTWETIYHGFTGMEIFDGLQSDIKLFEVDIEYDDEDGSSDL